MNAAAEVIYDLVDPSANLIFGVVIDQSLSGQVSLEGLEIYIYIDCHHFIGSEIYMYLLVDF